MGKQRTQFTWKNVSNIYRNVHRRSTGGKDGIRCIVFKRSGTVGGVSCLEKYMAICEGFKVRLQPFVSEDLE